MEAILAFLKRPWILLVAMVVIMIPALLFIYTRPAIYQSQAVVSTSQSNAMGLIGMEAAFAGTGKGRDENYYISILESQAYKNKIAELVISAHPELQSSADSISGLVNTSVSFTKKTRAFGFFTITAKSATPSFAKFLADYALESFESITVDLRRKESNLVAIFVEKQIESLNESLAENEAQIQSFIEKRNMSFGDITQGVDTELRNLQTSLSKAQTERDLASLKIDRYTAQMNDRVSKYITANKDTDESKQIKQLNADLNRLTELSNDSLVQADSVRFSAIQRDRQEILQKIAATVGGQGSTNIENNSSMASVKNMEAVLQQAFVEYEAAQIRYTYFKNAVEKFIQNNPDLPKDILEFFNLTRTKNVLQKTIDILVEMREKTRIQLASETGGVEVIDYPSEPTSPVSQRREMKTLAIILIAVFVGIAGSYFIDRFDNTIQGEADLQNRFNLPIYGSIPVLDVETNRRARHRSSRHDHKPTPMGGGDVKRLNFYPESSPIAEAYHSIKTAIEFTKRDKGAKSFVITSPVASDGKSLTTYNLGVSFAHGGMKVIIIDADLRRASQHKLLETSRTPGLADILHGNSDLDKCVVPSSTSGLFFLPAGSHVSNPATLLSSNLVREFLNVVEQQYDLVLIDTPPITPCMDSRHLALMTGGGLILVVRAEKTKINILEHSLNLLGRANVEILGVIINHTSLRYGYGYYYMYQYYNPYGYYYSGYYYYYHQDAETGEKVKKKHRKKRSEKSEPDEA